MNAASPLKSPAAPSFDSVNPLKTEPGGRPRKLDDEAKRLVVALLQKGHTLSEAAAFVACDRDTILNERKRDPQFDTNVKRARNMRVVRPLDVIYRASLTSWRAAAWLIAQDRRLRQEAREARRISRAEERAEKLAQEKAKASQDQPAPRPASPVASSPSTISAPTPESNAAAPASIAAATAQPQSLKHFPANRLPPVIRRRVPNKDGCVRRRSAKAKARLNRPSTLGAKETHDSPEVCGKHRASGAS